MKVWITKYALSRGIEEVDAEQSERYPTMVAVKGYMYGFHGEGRQWHRTKESAVIKATEMRDAKIRSLRKQLAKIEALSFR